MLCISYCGINCSECEVFIATNMNDNEKRGKLAEAYSTEKCKFTKEDIRCMGCHSKLTRKSKMCSNCEIRNCAKKKKIFTCAECRNYPCDLIEKYVSKESENRRILDKLNNSK